MSRPPPYRDARARATPRKPKVQGESAFSAKLRKALTLQLSGSRWMKMAGNEFMENGISDLLGCADGRFVAIEVKTNKNWFDPLQVQYLKSIDAAGGVAIGYLKDGDTHYIIPVTALGQRGNRHRELWVEIDFPSELHKILWSIE